MQSDPQRQSNAEHDSVTLAKDATTWRKSRGHFRQESTLCLRDKQEGAGARAGLQSESELNHGQGIETRHVHWLQWGTGLPVSLPRMCLGSSRRGEAREAWWEIKGRNKA